MKNILLFSFFLFISFQLMAVKPVHAPYTPKNNVKSVETIYTVNKTVDNGGGLLTHLFKNNKTIRKMATWVKTKLFNKAAGIDLNDPVMKWLWYAIILLVVEIVLSVFFYALPFTLGLSWLASILIGLIGLAAAICFIYWLILYLDLQT